MLKLGVFAPVRASSLTTEERLHTIRSSMFLKHKISPQGHFIKCKARLVALYVTSVKQAIVTKSSTESELVAFSDVTSEIVCMRNFAIG